MDFKSPTGNPTVGLRDQVIVAGANDGIFRIFDAGDLGPDAPPARSRPATPTARASSAPASSRTRAAQREEPRARLAASRDFYYADGSPTVADVWFYTSPTVSAPASKTMNEWRTVAVSGMRQGGNQYFALDITSPSDAGYPGYLWEFPRENDAGGDHGRRWARPGPSP